MEKKLFIEVDYCEIELRTLAEILTRGPQTTDERLINMHGKYTTGRALKVSRIVLLPMD